MSLQHIQGTCVLSLLLKAELASMAQMRQQVALLLKFYCLEVTQRGHVLLALTEIFSNILRHSETVASFIHVNVFYQNNQCVFVLEHDGSSYTDFNAHLAAVTHVDENAFLLQETGMGMMLIAKFFPQCRHEVGQSTNRVVLPLTLPLQNIKPVVLVVDDDPIQRMILEDFLRDDFDTRCCESAESALRLLKVESVDIILSDISMANMDGFEFRRQVLQLPVLTDTSVEGDDLHSQPDSVPFVYISGREDLQDLQQASVLGVNDYLFKPIDKSRLIAVVNRVLTSNAHMKQVLAPKIDDAVTAALWSSLPDVIAGHGLSMRTYQAQRGGGDFVFHHALDDKHILVLADVMGHDETAKFFAHAYAGYLRGTLCALTHLPQKMPLELSEIMAMFSKTIHDDDFLNRSLLTCLIIEVCGRQVNIGCAAHPPPLLFNVHGQMAEITVEGPLLALSQDNRYTTQQITLAAGERLICYTDGYVEGLMGNMVFQRAEAQAIFQQRVNKYWDLPLAAFSDALIDCDVTASDDATILIIEGRSDNSLSKALFRNSIV